MTDLTGGCACGRIRYALSDTPIFQIQCYCTDCKKASGSAFAQVWLVASDRLSVTGDEPRYHSVKADSGRTMERGFCGSCGSPVVIRRPETPQFSFIQAGSLDDPSLFIPSAAVFACHASAMTPLPPGVPAFDRGPSPEIVRKALDAHAAQQS